MVEPHDSKVELYEFLLKDFPESLLLPQLD